MPFRMRKRVHNSADNVKIEGIIDFDELKEVIPFNYKISSFGADIPVDSIVRRMDSGDIFVPLFKEKRYKIRFQREYVWKKYQADRFIESLLLGLPVPGIFLVKEKDGRHLVLDGHQRLMTLSKFYKNDWEGKEFILESVQHRFVGKTYQTLDAVDRRRLDDSIIHATIIKQDDPRDELSSVYLIFERLNSSGTILQPQEIRVALYHGKFVELLIELNEEQNWRNLFGKKSKRLKDSELILRFFALLEWGEKYKKPMKGFLSNYIAYNRNIEEEDREELTKIFNNTTEAIVKGIGKHAFKLKTAINAALVDAVMVGVANRIRKKGEISKEAYPKMKSAFRSLKVHPTFIKAITSATTDEENVKRRIKISKMFFAGVE